jgi:antitoxin MazE
MVSRVQKWGNSLAVRIPKAFAEEIKVTEYSSIQIVVKDNALHISPFEETKWLLEEFLDRVTEENIHGEWQTGHVVGKELL